MELGAEAIRRSLHDGCRGRGGVDEDGELGLVSGGGSGAVDGSDMGDGEITVLLRKDAVFGLGGAVDVMGCVRLVRHESERDVFRKEELAYVGGVASGVGLLVWVPTKANLEVNMVDAALIEAGKDGLEVDDTVRSGDLNPTEEGKVVGRFGCWRTAGTEIGWWSSVAWSGDPVRRAGGRATEVA
jgi:hypothetical protein